MNSKWSDKLPSLTQRRKKEYVLMQRSKGRRQQGTYLVEGVRLVSQAIEAGQKFEELVVTHAALEKDEVRRCVEECPGIVLLTDNVGMRQISTVSQDQGILGIIRMPPRSSLIPDTAQRALILDRIQDPGNVGTLLRTAAWFGVDAVVAVSGTADFFNPKVVRASMGGIWGVSLVYADALEAVLSDAKSRKYTLYGAHLEGEAVNQWKPAQRSILVIGSEAHGLDPVAHQYLNGTVRIGRGQEGKAVESLNASVAGGILLYQWQANQ